MVAILLLTLLQAPPPAAAKPAAPAPTTQAPTPRPAAPASNLSLTLFVTDGSGKRLSDVTVTLTGPVERELKTPPDAALRVTGLRPGTYHARFARDGFSTFERSGCAERRNRSEARRKQTAPPQQRAVPTHPTANRPWPDAAPAPPSPNSAGAAAAGRAEDDVAARFIEQISFRAAGTQRHRRLRRPQQAVLCEVREPWDDAGTNRDAMLCDRRRGRHQDRQARFSVAAALRRRAARRRDKVHPPRPQPADRARHSRRCSCAAE